MLVWVDIETTGLDPERDLVLEVAFLLSDDVLHPILDESYVIHHRTLPPMDTVVREMHGKNGLLDEVSNAILPPTAVEVLLQDFLKHYVGKEPLTLAGSSPHFDRAFLRKHMHSVEALFHYRMVDVSTVKELAKRWRPSVYESRPKGLQKHRALSDIHDSIEELKHYRRNFFEGLPILPPQPMFIHPDTFEIEDDE